MAHLKKGADGHLLKNADGHLVKDCDCPDPTDRCGTGGAPASAVLSVTSSSCADSSDCTPASIEGSYSWSSLGSTSWYDGSVATRWRWEKLISGSTYWHVLIRGCSTTGSTPECTRCLWQVTVLRDWGSGSRVYFQTAWMSLGDLGLSCDPSGGFAGTVSVPGVDYGKDCTGCSVSITF